MAMQCIDMLDVISLAVMMKGKEAVYLSNNLEYDDSDIPIWTFIQDQCKEKYREDYYEIISNVIHGTLVFFDTTEERDDFYSIFSNPIVDSSALYARVYDCAGTCITENT